MRWHSGDIIAARYELGELIEVIIPLIQCYDTIDRAYIFGSYARGEADARSDVDVRIDADRLENMDLCALMVRLERALGMPVDIIPTDSIPEEYLCKVREHEVLIYER
ncbi:MAG: nucleotidyltransferase domain-containing protein [Candidatus Methanoplasma sp.]|jgi:predicted nucleotidyltransferase|nr:nucleotidyltransferase domain-containing protein [Candidatus Methanoplasma sp.]